MQVHTKYECEHSISRQFARKHHPHTPLRCPYNNMVGDTQCPYNNIVGDTQCPYNNIVGDTQCPYNNIVGDTQCPYNKIPTW